MLTVVMPIKLLGVQSLFACIVSTENMRKDTIERKDMSSTKYTYHSSSFLILFLIKSRLGTLPLLTICLLYLQIRKQKIKLCVININQKIKKIYIKC